MDQAVARFAPIVRSVACSFNIRGYDREDLEQECWIAVLKALPAMEPSEFPERENAFMRTAAKHRLIDLKRAQDRRPVLESEQDQDKMQDEEPRDCRVSIHLSQPLTAMQSDLVEAVLSGERQVDVARAYGVSRQSVHRMMNRVRAKTKVVVAV